MAGGLSRKRKKTNTAVTNRGHEYTEGVITPATKRTRIHNESTNTAASSNTNNVSPEDPPDEFKSYLNKLTNEETGELRVDVIASKVIELLEHVFADNEEDMAAALKLINDDLEVWQPAVEDDEDDDGDDEIFDDIDEVCRAPEVKANKKVVPVDYQPGIFWYHKFVSNEVVTKETMKSNRKNCRKQLLKALDSCGSLQHQMYMIHRLLTRGSKAGIGLGLGIVKHPIRDEATAKKVILRIDDLLHSDNVLGCSTNDSLAFQKTVFLAIAPTAPNKDDATDEEKKAHILLVRDIARLFALKGSAKVRLWNMSKVRRGILKGSDDSGFLVQTYKRKSRTVINAENKAIVKNWVQCGTDLVIPSPYQRDARIVRDEDGIKTHSEPVYLYKFGKGRLYDEFKKSVAEGGCRIATDEEGTVIVHRTTFEKLLPLNLRRMTATHKQICGCKEHKNMQYKHEALLRNRDGRKARFNELLNFRYKQGEPGHEELKAARDGFVKAAFTNDGKHIWPTANEAYLCMTCKPIGDQDWMVPYRCTLGLCDDCPPLPSIPTEDCWHTRNPANKVTYKEICTEYSCDKHSFIPGGTANCLACEAAGIPKKQRPKVTHGEREMYKSCSIAEFMTEVYVKQLRVYSQHRFLCCVLGKRGCLGQREASALENGCVICHRDYTTKLPMEFNNATMGVGRNGVPTVGMEGMVLKFMFRPKKKPGDEEEPEERQVLWWFGYLSDEKQQDARTSFVNSMKMLMEMTISNLLEEDMDQCLFVVSDGCAKQYKCGNALQTYIWLSDAFRIPIDIMITAPYHGKSLVDALAGVDKSLLRQKLTDPNGFDSATRDGDGNIISQAEVCCAELSHESRKHGLVVDTKHKKRPDQAKVDLRHYEVSNYTKLNPIPFKDCTFKAHPSQFGNEVKSGLAEHFHVQTHPDLPLNTCAMRRIPCYCLACKEQSSKPWDYSKTYEEQDRYQSVENCILKEVMGDMNEWKFILVDLTSLSDKAKKQVNLILQLQLARHIERISLAIEINGYGAISCSDKKEPFWLVKWMCLPYQLESETVLEGCGDTPMPVGTWVCKGTYYDKISYAPNWYEKQRGNTLTFWVQHVMDPDVDTDKYNKDNRPPSAAKNNYNQHTAPSCVVFVPSNVRNLVKKNKDRLEKLTLYLVNEAEADGEEESVNEKVGNERTRRAIERVEREGFFELEEDKGIQDFREDDDFESEPLWTKEDEWDSQQEQDDSEEEELEAESEDEAY